MDRLYRLLASVLLCAGNFDAGLAADGDPLNRPGKRDLALKRHTEWTDADFREQLLAIAETGFGPSYVAIRYAGPQPGRGTRRSAMRLCHYRAGRTGRRQ